MEVFAGTEKEITAREYTQFQSRTKGLITITWNKNIFQKSSNKNKVFFIQLLI